MSGVFDDPSESTRPLRRPNRRPRALVPTLAVVVGLVIAYSVFVSIYTERLWFESVGYTSVFTKLLVTRVVLFLVFGVVITAAVIGNSLLAYRLRPLVTSGGYRNPTIERYQDNIEPLRKWLVIAGGAILMLAGGMTASGRWAQYLLWRNRVSFGQNDVYFHKDISFFVFSYPWYRFLISFVSASLILTILAAAATHYLYGGIRLQAARDKVSRGTQTHLSILLGLFMLVRAVSYWLDRYGLALSQSHRFTGVSYTDAHAVLPAKNILAVIALICAALFFANVIRPTLTVPALGFGLLILSAILIGGIWPAIVQRFQVKPSEPDKESAYIARNITATRDAYGLTSSKVEGYPGTSNTSAQELRNAADQLPSVRLIDPQLVSQAFEQLQQVRGFYRMPNVLDVDRYNVGGVSRDIVIAARELNLGGLGVGQRNWNNDHTVFTHGYGLVAAYGADKGTNGAPHWAEQDLPSRGDLGSYEQRIYYGEMEPDYSIVGRAPGTPPVELNIPDSAANGGQPDYRTYDGKGGVPIGSTFRRLLYATKFTDSSMLLSGRVDAESRIIYNRSPKTEVSKVAPWLTLDGDPYPAIVNGRILWIVDGYTTSNSYPQSERISLTQATNDSLTGANVSRTTTEEHVNYIRNAVKATVDAYDGTVTLYQWDTTDPMLKAWMKVFPDTVKPKSAIPPDLMAHLRYPQDLFKVQRLMLSRYHVMVPLTFYNNSDAWKVPTDPTQSPGSIAQPPYYLSVALPGQQPEFSLTSTYVPQSRQNLAAFVAVNANATSPSYGQMTVLKLPTDNTVPGVGQVENQFNSDATVTSKLQSFRLQGAQSKELFGNLLALPIGGQMLYVQPIYTFRGGEGSYPILQFVVVSINNEIGIGTDFNSALADALSTTSNQGGGGTGGGTGNGGNQTPTQQFNTYLDNAKQEFQAAQTALTGGDLGAYQLHNKNGLAWLDKAIALRDQPPAKSSGG